MDVLTREQALALSPEELAARLAQRDQEFQAQRAALKAQAEVAMMSVDYDTDGTPMVKIRADDPDAWKTVMFHSQRLRDRGDQTGRTRLAGIAHAFEMGYWSKK